MVHSKHGRQLRRGWGPESHSTCSPSLPRMLRCAPWCCTCQTAKRQRRNDVCCRCLCFSMHQLRPLPWNAALGADCRAMVHLPPSCDALGVPQRQEIIVPADQEKLSEATLAEEVPRSLMAKDPNLRTAVVCYSFADNGFKQIPAGGGDESVAFHFVMEGSMLHKGEAARPLTGG